MRQLMPKKQCLHRQVRSQRCFLLRLGYIGNDYKADRKILLKRLSGSSAFKSGAKKTGKEGVPESGETPVSEEAAE